jgi:NADH dehydrogenase
MKVFLTGATGFVGKVMLHRLRQDGHVVRCLVRSGSEKKLPVEKNVEVRLGDATDPATLEGAMEGCDAVIHLVGIIREFPARGITFEKLHVEATRNMVNAAKGQGIKRYIQMSANGVRPDARADYHKTKWRAEEAVRQSGLNWTIFRPSLIFGPEDEFINELASIIRKTPIVPVFGDGNYRLAPVAVEDVAECFCQALRKEETLGQTYAICGPQDYSYDELLDEIGQALDKKSVRKLHQPLCLIKPVVALMENFSAFPITTTQLTMLLEGNVCDAEEMKKVHEVFEYTPKELPGGIRAYLR